MRTIIYKLNYINNKGNITVMLSLMLSAILIFMLTVCEGMHIYLQKSRLSRSVVISGESTMADYNRFLWDNYGVLALDEGYGTDNYNALPLRYNEYMLEQVPEYSTFKTALNRYLIDEVNVEDRRYLVDDPEYMLNEIRELMKYQVAADGIEKIIDVKDKDNEEDIKKAREDVKESKKKQDEWKEDDKDKEEESPAKEEEVKDPRKEFQKILDKGVLALVIGENSVSDKDYGLRDIFDDESVIDKSKSKDKKIKFEDADELSDMLDSHKLNKKGNDLTNLALTIQYSKDYFGHYELDGSSDAMCQMEYLICGKENDAANLKSTVDRIVALRFPANYLYVVKSVEHNTEARELATALVGATGNVGLIEVVTYLLLGVLAYSETIIDVRSLLKGGKVPLVHNKETFKLNFKNFISTLISKADNVNSVKVGMDYEDYLTLMMITMPDSNLKYKRMLTLMDALGRQDDPGFSINRMLFSYKVNVKASPVYVFPNVIPDTSYSFERVISY